MELGHPLEPPLTQPPDELRRVRTLRLVAHDVNNPLAAIRILAEMLESEAADPQARQDLGDLLEAVDAASGIIESLSALLRSESEPRPLALAEADLGAIAERVVARPALRGHVEYVPPAAPVTARVDVEAVQQALTDVAINAARLASEGTRVRLDVVASPTPAYVASWQGPVVPADQVEALLTPWRAVDLRDRRVPVSALGLAYAAWVARSHQGQVEVDGPGRTIRLVIPA